MTGSVARLIGMAAGLALAACSGGGGEMGTAPVARAGALECMLVNAGTARPDGWTASIGGGSVSASAEEWQETWMRLTARDEAPAKPLPPGMKAIAVTERPGSSCYSYVAVSTISRAPGQLDVEFHLRDIPAMAGPVGSVCMPNVAQRSLVVFVPTEAAREVRFIRKAPVGENLPRTAPPACPALRRN
jgi:hypothetical protein